MAGKNVLYFSTESKRCENDQNPDDLPANLAAPQAVKSAEEATRTGIPRRSDWNCIKKEFLVEEYFRKTEKLKKRKDK